VDSVTVGSLIPNECCSRQALFEYGFAAMVVVWLQQATDRLVGTILPGASYDPDPIGES
jgi:hypothetical protein